MRSIEKLYTQVLVAKGIVSKTLPAIRNTRKLIPMGIISCFISYAASGQTTFDFSTSVSGYSTKAFTNTVGGNTLSVTSTTANIYKATDLTLIPLSGSESMTTGDSAPSETSVTFSLQGGLLFDLTSFKIRDELGFGDQATITTSGGKTANFTPPSNITVITVNTSGFSTPADFTNISSFTITVVGGTLGNDFVYSIDDLVLTNIHSSTDVTPPTVSSVSSSTANGTYKPADVIAVTVNFSENVTVIGTPQITLETGTTDRTVNYSSGTGTSTLTFNYTVQSGDVSSDLDYISTSALALNGGTIKDNAGNNATLTLASPSASGSLGANKAIVVDGVAPTVSGVSSSTANGTYKIGDVIAVTVSFLENVTVIGTPQITLETGTTDRTVNYSSGTGTSTLTFNYTVQSGDVSSDLDYTSTSALALNSGTIKDAAGNNATLTLASPGASGSLGANKAIVVDGVVPTVSGVSSGTANGTYKIGDVIAVTVSFSENVTVTGTPQITLETGTTDRTVNYSSGTGTSTLTFNYTVQSGDVSSDLDYTSTSALALNSGTIKDAAGNDATLTLASPGASGSLGANKAIVVEGVAPTVSSVSVPANGTYASGQNLDFTINASENITVNTGGGTPQLSLTIGSTTRQATYQSGSGSTSLVFRYTVQAGELDTDGIAVGTLSANGGTLRDAAGNNLNTTLNSVGNTSLVLVSTDVDPPSVSSITVSGSPAANAASVIFVVSFNETANNITTDDFLAVNASGSADGTVSSVSASSGSAVNVTVGSLTGTGSIRLLLNGFTDITDNAGNGNGTNGYVPNFSTGSTHSMDRDLPVVSTVNSSTADGTYKAGDVIAVTVNFSEAVTVTGTPQLTLETGTTDRIVNYSSGSGTSTLTFNYTIQSGDVSVDLEYTSTGALALNGGTINDGAGNNATLTLPGLSTSSLGALKNIVVDGVAPAVSSVNSSTANGTYKIGDVIAVTVSFSENVTVTGTPQITLETGTTDRTVNYSSGTGTSTLTFNYTVQSGDVSSDLDYTSTSALALNSGTIKDAAGNNATLTLASPGASGSLGANKAIVIDGLAPTVSAVSGGAPNGTYDLSDAMSITVTFSEDVIVTGTPQLTLETGTTDRTIDYNSGSGTSILTFVYQVEPGDVSSDLDYTSTSALALNGGTIKDAAGNNATLTLASPGASGSLGANKAIVIDGVVPTVSGVSSGTANGTYKIGDVIAVTVSFSENVTVTGTPQITLETGTTDRTVNYTSGTGTATLTFNYTVQSGDVSSDLDYTSTGALALNSGTIKDAAGNNATLTLASPGASGSLGANKAIVVEGVAPTVSSVSSGTANGTYKIGDVIAVTVSFSENVTVTGTPQITLETGTTDRTVNYTSGTGTSTLTFNYTVQSGDVSSDLDYTGTSALALNSGTIKDAAGNSATLTLASPGASGSLGANKAIVVDGAVPTVSSVSSSSANGSYKTGDVIDITVNFSENVTVTGTPQITLETGTTDRTVNYTSGTGTATLTFNYTVQSGDVSSDLDYTSTGALALNSGTIKDAAGNNATLTLASPGASGSLGANKAIVVDGVVPTITGVSSTDADGIYKSGDIIAVTVTFSESVIVSGTPKLTLETGTPDRSVDYASGSGTSTLTFNYTVQSGDQSSDLDYTGTGALGLNGGTINDGAGNNATLTLASPGAAGSLGNSKAIVVDGSAPSVSSVSSTTGNGTYKTGDVIAVSVTFSEVVTVTGTPLLTLETGATDRTVDYVSGSGTSILLFNYTIQSGDQSADLDYTGSGALSLNGGTIKSQVSDDAALTLPAPGASGSLSANKAIEVDGIVPVVNEVNSSTANGSYKTGDVIAVTVSFSENVAVTGTPQITLETGATDRTVNYSSGSGTSTLTFTYTIQSGDQSSDLDYTGSSALALNSGTIKDAAGNNATLTLPAAGASGSLGANKAIVADGIAPVVSGVSSSTADGAYKPGDVIAVTVTFSEAVTVTGTPQLTLETGVADRTVNYASGSGTSTLTFNYTVQSGDQSSDLDYTGTGALGLNSGSIKDAAGNNASLALASPGAANSLGANKNIIADGISPVITSVAVPANGTYGSGQNLDFAINASESVVVATSGGTPQLSITVGSTVRQAVYQSGSGTAALLFRYTIQAGEVDTDGITVGSLSVNGGTIKDVAGNSITVALNGVGSTSGVLIDAVLKEVQVVLTTNVSAGPTNTSPVPVTATFEREVTGFSLSDISVTNGTASGLTTSDNKVFRFSVVAVSDGEVEVKIPKNAAQDLSGNGNTISNAIKYTFDGTVPTATLSKNVADATNLTTAVVSLQFTEDVSGLTTDDFQVTRGTITALSGSGKAYSLTCNLTEGVVQVTIMEGAVKDAAGNSNPAATLSWTVDLTGVVDFKVKIVDKVINTLNEKNVSFEITEGEDQAKYDYAFSSEKSAQKITGSGVMTGTFTVVSGIDLSGLPDGTLILSVTMTDRLGNIGQTVQEEVTKKTDVDIPEGLSSNGDGANDTWLIPGIDQYPNNKVTIFNRWGSVVYEATGYNNQSTVFSGLSNKNFNFGTSLPDGTYYYVVQLSHDAIRKGYLVIKK